MKYFPSLFLVLILLSGCTANESASELTLNTVSMFGEGDSAAQSYQELISGFMSANPGIAINDQSEVSSEEWKSTVLENFQSDDTTPDVIFYFTGAPARNFILENKVVSIDEIQEIYTDYGNNIRPSAMGFMEEFDGEYYALPAKGFWEGLYCNKDIFDEYGLSLPDNWEAFMTAIDVFNENGVIPVAASLNEIPHYWIEHLILSQGGSVEHALNPKNYVPLSWTKGLDWFHTLYERGAFPADTNTINNADATQLFLDKKAAMILDGSWLMQSITDIENTVVLSFPLVPDGTMENGDIIAGYSSGFYISRKAWEDNAKRDLAISFVNYMTTEESIVALCENGGAPAVDIVQTDGAGLLLESASNIQQNAKNATMPIDSKLYKDAWQYLCAEIKNIASGKISAEEVMKKVSELNKW